MPDGDNGNGNVKTRIDVALLQQSFVTVAIELKELAHRVSTVKNEIINAKEELKDDIADIRSDIKLLFFKTGIISAGSGTVAAGIITIIVKLIG